MVPEKRYSSTSPNDDGEAYSVLRRASGDIRIKGAAVAGGSKF
jgi:hypothetical protein